MEKLDGINISEAAQIKCTMREPALGRRKRLTQVNAILLTFNALSANMWNTAHVNTSKLMTLTRDRDVSAATPPQKCQNGSALAEITDTDAMSIGIA